MSKARTQLWASGGGVQSAAIAALIVQGHLRPDLAVIVDTEREQSTTWAYMDAVITPALAAVGVKLHRVKKSEFATVDLYGGKTKQDLLLPVFTTQSGEIGKMPTFCSNEWKTRVMRRWATKQGVEKADVWIGFSTDEMGRCKRPGRGKWRDRYVLLERKLNREECESIVRNMGWPKAPRSSCWNCPNHTQEEWIDIRDNKPRDWRQAVSFDKWMRQRDPHAFLHADCVPLDQADLSEANGVLFSHCDTGLCFV